MATYGNVYNVTVTLSVTFRVEDVNCSDEAVDAAFARVTTMLDAADLDIEDHAFEDVRVDAIDEDE